MKLSVVVVFVILCVVFYITSWYLKQSRIDKKYFIPLQVGIILIAAICISSGFIRSGKNNYYIEIFPSMKKTESQEYAAKIVRDNQTGIYQLKSFKYGGQEISFSESGRLSLLQLNKRVTVIDNKGKPWYIEFYNKHIE